MAWNLHKLEKDRVGDYIYRTGTMEEKVVSKINGILKQSAVLLNSQFFVINM